MWASFVYWPTGGRRQFHSEQGARVQAQQQDFSGKDILPAGGTIRPAPYIRGFFTLYMPPSSLSLRLYFNNPVGSVYEHPDGYAFVVYEPGPRRLDYLQAFLTHTSHLLKLRGWNKMLGDQRRMAPFTPEESAWIVDYWLSRSQQARDTVYGAVLVPDDVFARLSVNNVMHEARTAALTYRLFTDETEARAWLRQLP